MDLEVTERLLEDLNRQTNQLIDLVRGLRKGEVFGEPLTATIKTKLVAQTKTRYDAFKTTFDMLTEEINRKE